MHFSRNLCEHCWTDRAYLYSKTTWGVKGKLKREEEGRPQTWPLGGLQAEVGREDGWAKARVYGF